MFRTETRPPTLLPRTLRSLEPDDNALTLMESHSDPDVRFVGRQKPGPSTSMFFSDIF